MVEKFSSESLVQREECRQNFPGSAVDGVGSLLGGVGVMAVLRRVAFAARCVSAARRRSSARRACRRSESSSADLAARAH